MARIFVHDAFARWSAPTIGRAINRSPGSPSLPSLTPRCPSIPGARHIHTDARSHIYAIHICARVHIQPWRSQFSLDLRGRDLRARRCPAAKIPGGDFLGSLTREYRFSTACEIALGVLFPSPALPPVRFPSVAIVLPLPFAAATEEATSMQRHGIEADRGVMRGSWKIERGGMMDMHFIMLQRLRKVVLEELRLRAINASYRVSFTAKEQRGSVSSEIDYTSR